MCPQAMHTSIDHPGYGAHHEAMSVKLKSQILRIRIERGFAQDEHTNLITERSAKLKELTKLWTNQRRKYLQDTSVRRYAPHMKCTTNNDVPTYVLVLQSTVLRNLHHVYVVDRQTTLVEEQSSRMVADMRQGMVRRGEETTLLEVQMLNDMARVQADEQDMHKNYDCRLSQQRNEISVMMLQQQEVHHHHHPTEDENDRLLIIDDDELDQLIESIAQDSIKKLEDNNNKYSSSSPKAVSTQKTRKSLISLGEMLFLREKPEKPKNSKHSCFIWPSSSSHDQQ